MGNHEIEFNPVEYRKQGLKEGILRKARVLLDNQRPSAGIQTVRVKEIDALSINNWSQRPFPQKLETIDKVDLVIYFVLDPFRVKDRVTGSPKKKEFYIDVSLKNSIFTYALSELENGQMRLEAYSDTEKKTINRKALISDLRTFDGAIDSAVSKTFASIFSGK